MLLLIRISFIICSTGNPVVGIHNAFVVSSGNSAVNYLETSSTSTTNFSRSRSGSSLYAKPLRTSKDVEDIVASQPPAGPLKFIRRNIVPVGVAATAAVALAAFPQASYAAMADLGSIVGGSVENASTLSAQLSDSGFYQSFSLVFLS